MRERDAKTTPSPAPRYFASAADMRLRDARQMQQSPWMGPRCFRQPVLAESPLFAGSTVNSVKPPAWPHAQLRDELARYKLQPGRNLQASLQNLSTEQTTIFLAARELN